MNSILEFIAILSAGLFSGAAIYINWRYCDWPGYAFHYYYYSSCKQEAIRLFIG